MEPRQLADLRRRCRFAAEVIAEAGLSWEREARRAAILCELWRSVPPEGVDLRCRWYVPLALARAEHGRLLHLSHRAYPAREICARTLRGDLRWLIDAGLIVRAPGDEKPDGRHADTLHLVRTPQEALWWTQVGAVRLAAQPDAQRKARLWRALFSSWREEVRAGTSARVKPEQPVNREAVLLDAIESGSRRQLLSALWRCGVRFRGGWRWKFARTFERAAAAVALLLKRAGSIGWPKTPAGWLCAIWVRASGEASAALHELRQRITREPGTGRAAKEELERIGIDLGRIFQTMSVSQADADLEAFRGALAL